MRILLVNQTFYPDEVATAQHLTDLGIALNKEGHEVAVLTSQRGYSEHHPIYPASEIYQGIRIIRVWPFVLGRKNKLIRAIDALCVNFAFFVRMLFLPRSDTVIALTSPPLVSFFACLVARLKKSRFIYWVMDMNPDEAIVMGWIREESWIAKLLKRCQTFVVKQSDKVIALDGYMKRRLIKTCCRPSPDPLPEGEGKEKKVVVIPPWSHDEDLEAVQHEENPFRIKHGLQNKFVVMYSGNHSVCHSLDTVLEAARLLAQDDAIVFMFIGGGARVQDVLKFKAKHSLNNIIQMDYVARSKIKFSLSAADLHLVVMGDNMAGIVHPCKVYGILALGRPFAYVGPEQSHIQDLIREGAVGYSVRHSESENLVQIIRQCQRMNKTDLDGIGEKNRAVAKTFSAKVLIPKLVAEFE
jgi:colanic acid biosynthesis glycosyl transferase WcaI